MTDKTPETPANYSLGFEEPLAKELEALGKDIAADLQKRNSFKVFIKKLRTALEKQDAALVLKHLAQPALSELLQAYPQAKPAIDLAAARAGFLRDNQIKIIESRLREYCNSHGLDIHGGSQKFVVSHFIEVNLGSPNRGLGIGNIRVKVISWNNVEKALDDERIRVWERAFDPGDFKTRLLHAYNNILQPEKNPTGWVRLHDIYQEFKSQKAEKQSPGEKKRLISYFRDEFSADLSKLLKDEAKLPGARTFEFSAIRDSRFAFKLVMPNGSIGSFGFVRPTKESR
jgi:hypothetical protein